MSQLSCYLLLLLLSIPIFKGHLGLKIFFLQLFSFLSDEIIGLKLFDRFVVVSHWSSAFGYGWHRSWILPKYKGILSKIHL